ncbi:endonuclease [Thermoanaerobacterium sp. RBIITD]|uniref:endonuclease n=1 Tax=Thermoanaerobacterium sp. RBIITD TaxID=1550240 RepID=UPI000BBF980C|nr:endonuclease [Thermoanaerobacterium sp. RBIITD]SNX53123.1 LAGLIDADG DNA endonuclease family protein [Thermoanaerobacterium sp. RBIITD]
MKEAKYLSLIPNIRPTNYQLNIIVGSILGDGNLSYAPRSRNAYYREHFCQQQYEYRLWKCTQLKDLGFKINKNNTLQSISHPIFSNLYEKFYIDNRKTITYNNIKFLNDAVGLACFYMDDCSLVISKNKKPNITVNPIITLYTLNFYEKENIILQEHIYKTFNVKFNLKEHPDGKKYILTIGKREEVFNFTDIVKPYACQISCMDYKWNIDKRIIEECKKDNRINLSNFYNRKFLSYTNDDISKIIDLKNNGYSDREIANKLNRSYWGIVWKIRDLKKKDKI